MSEVAIRYTRPPDRTTVFRQHLVERTADCVVTLLDHSDITRSMIVHGATVLEPGSPIVWFTFPGLWHDVGRFHTADGRFTGYYANVLTPVQGSATDVWETTDLFLDVWLDDAGPLLLDEDELDAALESGAVTTVLASRARSEARRLIEAARAAEWPPRICRHWTLERARHARGGGTGA